MTVRISHPLNREGVNASYYLEADVIETQGPTPGVAEWGRWRVRFKLTGRRTTGSFAGAGDQIGLYGPVDQTTLPSIEFGRVARTPWVTTSQSPWEQTWDVWIYASPTGYWSGSQSTMPLAQRIVYGSTDVNRTGSLPLPRIPQLPGKPAIASFTASTVSSISFRGTTPSADPAAPIVSYDWQVSQDPAFPGGPPVGGASGVVQSIVGGVTAGVPTNTVDYWVRYRARTATGSGPWSDAVAMSATVDVVPDLDLAPDPDGLSLRLTASTPGYTSSNYSVGWERQNPDGTVSTGSTNGLVGVDYTDQAGLTPGATYRIRARKGYGYTVYVWDRTGPLVYTPWTPWQTIRMPSPLFMPGQYFDGDTADVAGQTFTWDGTPHQSTSRVTGPSVLGWTTFDQGSAASGGAGIVRQSMGSRSGQFAAEALFSAPTSAPGFVLGMDPATGAAQVGEGATYWGSIYAMPSVQRDLRAVLQFLDANGVAITTTLGDPVTVPAGEYRRLVVTDVAPVTSVAAVVLVQDVGGTWAGGDSLTADDAMVTLDSLYPYFNGSTPDSAEFTYAWEDAPNASPSQRSVNVDGAPDPLADPDCPPVPSPPRPPRIDDECIVQVGSWRRYWAIIPAEFIPLWTDVVPTFTITTDLAPARQVRIRLYENPAGDPPESFDSSVWISEQVVSYIPANTVLTIDGVARRAWADINGAGQIAADRLLYGTAGGPATWPTMSCGVQYLASFDVPLDDPLGAISIDVALTGRMM